MIEIGVIGFIAEACGLGLGILGLYLLHIKNPKLIGMLFGFTSGLMLAMVSFDILPEALSANRVDLVGIGMLIGAGIGLLLDEIVPSMQAHFKTNDLKMSRAGIILVLGIAIHNIPEGFSLGTLAFTSPETIVHFSIVLGLHSIPEGIALAIPFKNTEIKLRQLLYMPLLLGAFMGMGSVLGFVLSSLRRRLVVTVLGMAAGIILYIICEELMPESKKIWNGRMTTIMAIAGMLFGLVLLVH